ncbi:uncharacterized protein ACHE_10613A [Aspergillus chevalieri]|uniref:Transcription factor domain-containing protein n=1 Tax=Aspergillus chevalieri TaxID=182096 RepID=A0A7R7ZJB6_ASPCH|nr:uncharacterized protein ACHE_10613A [Aspergillus chevalieri]BCR83211.1 hypothetical protein ACHE_10613A [Aspergillus chevalieri]
MRPLPELKTIAHAFFQASEYFNARIFPSVLPILELGSNSAIYQISPKLLQNGLARPDYVRLGLVCASLSHRMNQRRDDIHLNSLAMTFFHYRGLIIRSLNDDIGVDHKRMSNLAVAGILTLIIVDSPGKEHRHSGGTTFKEPGK